MNNLGGVPLIEITLVAGIAVQKLKEAGIKVKHVTSASFVTSLEMFGFSLTLVECSSFELDAMLHPVESRNWVPPQLVCSSVESLTIPLEMPEETETNLTNLNDISKNAINLTLHKIIAFEPQLTEWDQKVGDGDCGMTWKRGAEASLDHLNSLPEEPSYLCNKIAHIISHSMGGTSGVILRLFFTAAGAALAGVESQALCSEKSLVSIGFSAGTKAVMHFGGAKVGSRTMVDALYPAMEHCESLLSMAAAAKEGANSTANLPIASHGRSAYLSESDLIGTPDPGAMAIALILEELAALF